LNDPIVQRERFAQQASVSKFNFYRGPGEFIFAGFQHRLELVDVEFLHFQC
jgi:hypothetical protein